MRILKVFAGTELERKKDCWSVYAKSAEASGEICGQLYRASHGKAKETGFIGFKCIFRLCYLCLDLSEPETKTTCLEKQKASWWRE